LVVNQGEEADIVAKQEKQPAVGSTGTGGRVTEVLVSLVFAVNVVLAVAPHFR
jgi:hypothetical protein